MGTVVSLLLLGLAVVSGLMLYYSPAFCWKGKIPFSSHAFFSKLKKKKAVGGAGEMAKRLIPGTHMAALNGL